jgi:hypothetical protein
MLIEFARPIKFPSQERFINQHGYATHAGKNTSMPDNSSATRKGIDNPQECSTASYKHKLSSHRP